MADRRHAEGFFSVIEYEINQEKAAVLGRYGKQAEAAIEICNQLLGAIEAGDASKVDAYKRARAAALVAIDKLCLQREVLGVYDNARVRELYRVPPPLAT